MKIAAYIHPTRVGSNVTGVGERITNMTLELGSRLGSDLRILATRREWEALLQREPETPLRRYEVDAIDSSRFVIEKAWATFGTPPAERWTGDVDWVYAPMEAYVPVRGARLAVTSHCMNWFEKSLPWYDAPGMSRERWRWRWRTARLFKSHDALLLTVSEFSKGRLVDLFGLSPDRIAVVGNGVESAYFDVGGQPPTGPATDPPYVLVVGGLTVRKGGDRVLKAAEHLRGLGSEIRIDVVGDSEPQLRREAARHSNVRMLGYVGVDGGLPELMRRAVAVYFPSRYETFGIPAAEAMAAGAPTVVSDEGALPEVVGDGGVILHEGDPEAAAHEFEQLLREESYRAEVSARGLRASTRHTWGACCDRLLAAFANAGALTPVPSVNGAVRTKGAAAGAAWRDSVGEAPREKSLTASIVVTTRNRKDELRQTLASCLAQRGALEILVIDDGSLDGTAEMVRAEFPTVRLERRDESKGLIVRRNEAARLARGDVIFSIDDDAVFSDERVVEQTLADFDDENIAAVAIPFANVNQSPDVKQQPPDERGRWLTNEYIGTAHAVRRELFNSLGGYREVLFHQGEEGDLCIRMLQAGYFVRLGRSAVPIWHYESPRRNRQWIEMYGQRNLMLFAWHNVPTLHLPIYLAATILKGLLWGLRRRCLWLRCRGTMRGAATIVQQWGERRPVNEATFRLYRRLKKRGPLQAPPGRSLHTATAAGELAAAGRGLRPATGLALRENATEVSSLESSDGAVSVVIVTHQRPHFLSACLKSCEKQIGGSREYIVVTNPADAESEEIAERFGAKVIRTHRNLGFFPALNLGIVNSSGRYVMVIDDDAQFEQADAVERLQSHLDQYPACAVVTCNIEGPCEGAPYPSTREIHVFKTGFALFRREVFDDIAGYVPDLFFRAGGETYVSNYIYDRGYHVTVLHDVWMYHAQTATGRSQRAMNFYALRNHALIVVLQEPALVAPASLVAKLCTTALRIGIQRGDMVAWFTGWLSALGNLPWALKHRDPISWASYKRLRRLRRTTGRAETPVVRQTADLSIEPVAS